MRMTTGIAAIEIIIAILLLLYISIKWNEADENARQRLLWLPSHFVFLLFFISVRMAFHVKLYLVPVSFWIELLLVYVYVPSFYLLYVIARYTAQLSNKRRGERA